MGKRTTTALLGTAALGALWLGASRAARRPTSQAPAATHTDPDAVDVLIIGAGLSGIGAARHLRAKAPGQRFEILETRQAIGGTWDLFRYPGVRSDSDVHTFGYSFKPWRGPAIAAGSRIRDYIQEAADEAEITPHIRFGHRVTGAAWSSDEALWTITAERTGEGGQPQTVTRRARFLFLCSGYYSYAEGHRPEFAGEADFQGQIVHPQFWPENFDHSGKRVVVIGSGATAITLVPSLAETAAHVTMLQRSPSDVAVLPREDPLAGWLHQRLPAQAAHGLVRWKNILITIASYQLARRRPELFRRTLHRSAREHLGDAFDPAAFTPRYRPWDQRVCVVPDGDLFKALREGRASVVTGEVEAFTPHGIRLRDGRALPADVIVTATGLKLNVLGDVQFTVDGRSVDPARSLVYKGMMLSGVPNAAYAFGYTNASWTLKAELTADYVCRLLTYMDRHGHRMVVARPGASVQERPLLSFTSGYVARGTEQLPKQGSRRPWQVYQNYLLDKYTIQLSPLDDGTLKFSGAAAGRPLTASAAR